jgi:hypothetical protein
LTRAERTVVDQAVDTPEAKRLIPDIELFQAREARPDDHVALFQILRSTCSLAQNRAQAFPSEPP